MCSGEIMDGEMYEKLMDMLDECKIDNDFVNELIEFSIGYEYGEYIKFFIKFKFFVDEKWIVVLNRDLFIKYIFFDWKGKVLIELDLLILFLC